MAGNIIVTTTSNRVIWDVDNNSYSRALKKIKSLKEAHEKPSQRYAATAKKLQQSEGKTALAAAKAQTAKLRQVEQLTKQQQKQAQIQAKMQRDAVAHANKMTSLQARQLSQQEQHAKANSRLAAISAKVRAASQHRAMTYNPNMGGQHSDPDLVARQTQAMGRSSVIASEMAATKKAMALEEKRQREKEAGLQREVTYYNSLRRSALTLANVNGADVATRYKAISAAKQALQAQKEQRFTAEETRFEMARVTTELRKQARLQQRITREQKAAGVRAGRVRTEGRGGRGTLAAAGAVGAATLIGSMGINKAGAVLQGSLERNQQMKALQSQGVSRLEYEAVRDVVANKTDFNISPDKALDFSADYRDKVGQLTANGVWKTNKKGETTLSGAGELGDLINAIAGKSNVATAKRVVNELDKLDFNTFLTYLVQLQKSFKFSDKEVAAFAESINDASKVLPAFADGGDAVQKRMNNLARNGYALSDAQQEQLNRLGALSVEYSRISNSLSDTFSAGFVSGLGDYAKNTDNLSKGMAGLVPITDELGKSLGEMASAVLKITSWFGSVNPDNKHEQLNESGWYYDDSAVGWFVNKLKSAAATFTGANTIPGVQAMPSDSYGSGTAISAAAKSLNIGTRGAYQQPINQVPGFNLPTYQMPQPTFQVPTLENMIQHQQYSVNVRGEAAIKLSPIDINVNDGAVTGLVDARIRDNELNNQNMILGMAQ